MSDQLQQCIYCPQWCNGDLHMAVHIEQAHSDLMPLFGDVPTHCPGGTDPRCKGLCTLDIRSGEIIDPDCFRQ